MIHPISIEDYLQLENKFPVLDVRSPKEFSRGHIPGAYSLPLFSDEERAIIGITYKKEGREPAILKGFEIIGPKWSQFIQEVLTLTHERKVMVHCWRGGMRSAAMAWALDFYGFEVSVLEGGYKSFRNWIRHQFSRPLSILILGGLTGSHKTEILQQFKKEGFQTLDLEDLAQHQGSAFGSMNKLIQPGQEQFENLLGMQISALSAKETVWVEDESQAIGKLLIPGEFWHQMENAQLIALEIPRKERVSFLAKDYGSIEADFLIHAAEKIKKRLGFQRTQQAIDAIKENRMEDFVSIVLYYYDKAYNHWIQRRPAAKVRSLKLDNYIDPEDCVENILKLIRS